MKKGNSYLIKQSYGSGYSDGYNVKKWHCTEVTKECYQYETDDSLECYISKSDFIKYYTLVEDLGKSITSQEYVKQHYPTCKAYKDEDGITTIKYTKDGYPYILSVGVDEITAWNNAKNETKKRKAYSATINKPIYNMQSLPLPQHYTSGSIQQDHDHQKDCDCYICFLTQPNRHTYKSPIV